MITQTPQIFKHEEFGNVRILSNDGEPWFIAADVCKILELSDVSKAVSRLDADEKGTNLIPTRGGNQNVLVVNESGLYALTMTSRKPEAKRFRKWVTSEVLPSVICVFCTAVTIFYLLFMDLPPEVNALMAMLNGVMIILGLVEDD